MQWCIYSSGDNIRYMPPTPFERFIVAVKSRNRPLQIAAVTGFLLLVFGGFSFLLAQSSFGWVDSRFLNSVSRLLLASGATIMTVVSMFQGAQEKLKRSIRIREIEKRVEENPKEPIAAWELARTKLENYVDRNLSQVRSIFVLTAIVMTCGFVMIGVGAYKAFEEPTKFQASVLTSVSGVLVSFLGGTFLVLYRSVMSQAKDYVTMLERINAVGMSVQILETLDDSNKQLRETTTAEIAKSLLMMYSSNIATKTKKAA